MDESSKEYLNEQEHAAYMEDFSKIMTGVIKQLISLADKHNVDRDNVIEHFSTLFSTMAQITTFDNFQSRTGS